MRKTLALFLLVLPLGVLLGAGGGQSIPMGALAVQSTTYHYFGLNCHDTATDTCSSGDSTQAFSGIPRAVQITTGSNAGGYSAKFCRVYLVSVDASPNDKYRCAIYTTGGALVSNCAQTTDQAGVVGWNESPMPTGCALTASTSYYIFVEANGAGTQDNASFTYADGYAYTLGWTYGNWVSSIAASMGSSAGYAFSVRTVAL